MNLVIVESPTKEKTISRFLARPDIRAVVKGSFTVKSSYGHIRDLPRSVLGVDEANGFKPTYITLPRARKILSSLKKLADGAEFVYLATDFDREGEAIAWHLAETLKLPAQKIRRITFHEITPQAITHALKHPRAVEKALVESQQARRVLDRLVGYKLSPLLWKTIANKLSAGRVQSAALKFIYDREREIEAFKPQEYWTVEAVFRSPAAKNIPIPTRLTALKGRKLDKMELPTASDAATIVQAVRAAGSGVVSRVSVERKNKSPLPPYVTSSLQMDASRTLRFSPSRTMATAQRLYEGVDLGGGESVGLITYMRTDSVNVSADAVAEARAFIRERHGERYLSEHVRVFKTKVKNAQEAHEAIRPTSVERTPELMKPHLTEEMFRLYSMIWKRFVATQMHDMVYEQTRLDVDVAGDYRFSGEGRRIVFDGYASLYPDDAEETALPAIAEGQNLSLERCDGIQHFTEPPARYNEASLIKELEKNGIGRPSTYASIVDTIKHRGYVQLKERKFSITPLGRQVIELLVARFPEIVDRSYTAKVEEQLDEISNGKESWQTVVRQFYEPLSRELMKAQKEVVVRIPEKTDIVCTACGAKMVVRSSRFGKFLSCERFPRCRHKMKYEPQGTASQTGI